MASPRIEYAVLPAGEGPGQDRCFTAEGLVVVLDGASAIDPVANPDATEYVDTLGPLLIEQITDTPGVDLRAALAEAIRETAEKLALVPGTAASSTVSIVRWGDETVDVLVLGDSPVVVHFADGSRSTLVQHPQEHIAAELRQHYRDRLRAGHGYDDVHRGLLRKIQQREAAVRNHHGGYWIAEARPDAAQFATLSAFKADMVRSVLLLTDGSANLPGDRIEEIALGRYSLTSSNLEAALRALWEWEENSDPSGAVLVRSKKHDDKTIALMAYDDLHRGSTNAVHGGVDG